MKGCIQMWYTATGWNGVHFLPREHALLCSEFVTRTVLLNTPAVLATAEQSLHNIKAFLFVSLGVGKGLGGNRVGTADTNQPKGYPILCIFMLRDKNLGVGGGTSSSIATAQSLAGHGSALWKMERAEPSLDPPSFTFEMSYLDPGIFLPLFFLLHPPPHCRRCEQAAVWVLTAESAHTRICKTCVSTAKEHPASYSLREISVALLTTKSTVILGTNKSGDSKQKSQRGQWYHLLIGFGFPSVWVL